MGTKEDNHDLDDSELDRLISDYRLWAMKRNPSPCPPVEDVLQYIEGTMSQSQLDVFDQHLPFCDLCQDIVLAFKQPVSEAAECPPAWMELESRLPEDLRGKPRRRWKRGGDIFKSWRLPRTGFLKPVAALLTSVILAAGAWLYWYPSELSQLARVEDTAHTLYVERSSGELKESPLRTFYRQGLDALVQSQGSILHRVDEAKVDEAIQYLEKAKRLAGETHNEPYLADCAFYLGKAYLKKNDVAQARRQFEEIMSLNGSNIRVLSRRREATALLDALARLESDRR